MSYGFDEKKREGDYWESVLDRHFSDRWRIQKVSLEEDRMGIDRIWVAHDGSEGPYKVQYKADSAAAKWGNALLECDVMHKDGGPIEKSWAHTCVADLLVYFVPPLRKAGIMSMEDYRRDQLPRLHQFKKSSWVQSHRADSIWSVRGAKIPLTQFLREFCFDVERIQFTEEDVRRLDAQANENWQRTQIGKWGK